MAAIVLNGGQSLTPDEFEKFLATQPDLSPKAWPRFVRINTELPHTATSKILKRELIRGGVTAESGVLWERAERSTAYVVTEPG
jgi:fatty-acyl-CoA synthase